MGQTSLRGELLAFYPGRTTRGTLSTTGRDVYYATVTDGVVDPAQKMPERHIMSAPSLALFQGKLMCVYREGEHDRIVYRFFDGTTWSDDRRDMTGHHTEGGTALAAYRGKFMCVYAAVIGSIPLSDDNHVMQCTTFDGTHWSETAVRVPNVSTASAPSLAIYKGRLYCAYKDAENPEVRVTYFSMHEWSGETLVVPDAKAGSRPSLAVYRGRLYCAYKDQFDTIRYAAYDGTSWMPETPTIRAGNYTSSPTLIVSRGKLQCAFVVPQRRGNKLLVLDASKSVARLREARDEWGDWTPWSPAVIQNPNACYD